MYTNLNNIGDDSQFSILTDRSQGATSLENNQIEIMVHRKTKRDDNKGVGEGLDEHAFGRGLVARGKHQITLLSPLGKGKQDYMLQ